MKYEFVLYDSFGGVRNIATDITVDELRIYLSEFKTHCAVNNSAYEYNHFVNWLKKYKSVIIRKISDIEPVRVDM